MKKIAIISNESIFSGSAVASTGETVDSLANAIAKDYEVSVFAPDKNGFLSKVPVAIKKMEGYRICKIFQVTYYLIEQSLWPQKGWELINTLQPNIVHNYADLEGYTYLTYRPEKLIYSFNSRYSVESVPNFEEHLQKYDAVRGSSPSYFQQVARRRDYFVGVLSNLKNFSPVKNGIATPVYAPESGLMLPTRFSATNQSGKVSCKKVMCRQFGIPTDKTVFIVLGGLNEIKGTDLVIEQIQKIKENNGFVVFNGRASGTVAEQLKHLAQTAKNSVLWINEKINPLKAIYLLSGADFCIMPSREEFIGLVPMQASRYGTIPIVSQVGGLADNFTADNAILIEADLGEALDRAFTIYQNKELLAQYRKAAMEQDFSWENRKQEYTNLYDAD